MIVVPGAETSDQGDVVFADTSRALSQWGAATVSFKGHETATTSFVNAAFVPLLKSYSFADLERRLEVVDSTWQINDIIKRTLEREYQREHHPGRDPEPQPLKWWEKAARWVDKKIETALLSKETRYELTVGRNHIAESRDDWERGRHREIAPENDRYADKSKSLAEHARDAAREVEAENAARVGLEPEKTNPGREYMKQLQAEIAKDQPNKWEGYSQQKLDAYNKAIDEQIQPSHSHYRGIDRGR